MGAFVVVVVAALALDATTFHLVESLVYLSPSLSSDSPLERHKARKR